MERTFDLNQTELMRVQQLQAENQQLLARYGAATLELESIKPALGQVQERQRDLIGQALARHGVQNFQAARIEGTNLIARLPDELMTGATGVTAPPPRTNAVLKNLAKE
jgi:hypothetical protein